MFDEEIVDRIDAISKNKKLIDIANNFMSESTIPKYCYNFKWQNRPIIQYPQDVLAMQEIIWKVKPDLIIETGIAHGGSLIFSASMLTLLDIQDCHEQKKDTLHLKESKRRVLGIDIDIRKHNKEKILEHSMSNKIDMLEGSSISDEIIEKVHNYAESYEKILICLDSNHTFDHVYSELLAYASLVSIDSYCVVFDTIVNDLPEGTYPDRPWGQNNNPKTAVKKFIADNHNFIIDKDICNKLLITVSPDGFLKRVN